MFGINQNNKQKKRIVRPGSKYGLLTMNYDLSLLDLCCFHCRDIADIWASVCHVNSGDGQDANSLSGVRQGFTIGLSLHHTFCLVEEKQSITFTFFIRWSPHDMRSAVPAAYLFARVRPLNVHPSIELHHCCAVQGEGLPHHQLYPVLRKQLDIINLTSCPGKRKGGGRSKGTEGGRQWERSWWHRQLFFLPHRIRGNGFPLDQRNHPTIKKLSVSSSHFFHSCVKLYTGEGN